MALVVSIWIVPAWLTPPPSDVVRASGRIEGREVSLAPKDIQSRVKKLFVDEGASVVAGQVLAELESNQLDARYAGLTANIAALDAQIAQASIDVTYTTRTTAAAMAAAEAGVSSARARVDRAAAVLASARADRDRSRSLYAQRVISAAELDQRTMTYGTSEADLEAAEKDLLHAQANLDVARAARQTIDLKAQQVRVLQEARRAAVAQAAEAEATLAERTIVAPSNGTILSRPVEVGDVVNPGAPVFVMVDMSRLYVKVYIPEPDIPKLTLGSDADVSVDAFPGRTFAARVTRIYDEAEFTPKNVETPEERVKLVFGVELTFVTPDALLKPGMPADCAIHWRPGAGVSNGAAGRGR